MAHAFVPATASSLFPLRINPESAFAHPAWCRARGACLDALRSGRHVVLSGPSGSGKSLLLRDVAAALRDTGTPARLIEWAEDLGSAVSGSLLLIDEADALPADALAFAYASACTILLTGHPDLASSSIHDLQPVCVVTLDRLAPLDVARFVAIRLADTGRPGDLFEAAAVLALERHSRGLMRLVNMMGAAAVTLAGLDGSSQVSERHVEEAASFCTDPAARAAPTMHTEPSQTGPAAALPNYRGAVLRRRTALGTMFAVSGVLFATPWVLARRSAGLLQAGATDAEQFADTAGGSVPPPTGGPAALETDAATLADASTPAVSQLAQPQPGEQQVSTADASAARPASPGHQADPLPRATRDARDQPTLTAANGQVLFSGPIYNETMGQGGHVTLVIRKNAPTGAITARFYASQGLSGAGILAGSVSGTGRITASGRLLMGKNPFICDLSGTLHDDTLTGSASFVRSGRSMVYHSRFKLVRA